MLKYTGLDGVEVVEIPPDLVGHSARTPYVPLDSIKDIQATVAIVDRSNGVIRGDACALREEEDEMNWSLSEYNLICYGNSDLDIFRSGSGTGSFTSGRLFECTSDEAEARYKDNLAGLAGLPALVVGECIPSNDPQTPAFFSSIEDVRASGKEVLFRFTHLHKVTSEEIFRSDYFKTDDFEPHRTHWAIKEGNLIESFFKLLQDSQKEDRPKFFDVESWPLPRRGHIAVMMPFTEAFSPVYETIQAACKALRLKTLRVDQIYKPTKIMNDVFSTILQGQLVICDLTGRNPNVLYETGLAHALNCEVILITQTMADVPFDLQQFRVIRYLPNTEGLAKLANDLQRTLDEMGLE